MFSLTGSHCFFVTFDVSSCEQTLKIVAREVERVTLSRRILFSEKSILICLMESLGVRQFYQ